MDILTSELQLLELYNIAAKYPTMLAICESVRKDEKKSSTR